MSSTHNKYTKTDHDNLADIIWWIKGYHAGAREHFEECPFSENHIESLIRARVMLQEKIDNGNS